MSRFTNQSRALSDRAFADRRVGFTAPDLFEVRLSTQGDRVDARAAWQGDTRECAFLYGLFARIYRGNFWTMRADRRGSRAALVAALRKGRPS